LNDMTAVGSFRSNPTLATGDFKVDIDGGGLTNLGTLPSVSPSATVAVLLSLSAAEMNGDVITVVGIDQTSPKEWADFFLCINTTAAGVTLTNVQGIKKNAALANFMFAMFDTSGVLKTGLQASLRTAGNSQAAIDGGAFADLTNIATITEISNGWYKVSFAAADLNGNSIAIRFAATGARELSFLISTVQV